jgi:hypothetical protein
MTNLKQINIDVVVYDHELNRVASVVIVEEVNNQWLVLLSWSDHNGDAVRYYVSVNEWDKRIQVLG